MGQRILIIEDEQAIAEAVAARLAAEGFDTHVAPDGRVGIEMFERLAPDLVVLDLMLPEVDGLEVCRRIQATRRVAVLMLTARDDESDLLVGLAVGADDYLTKPFSQRELVARIRAVLRRTEGDPVAQDLITLHELDLELDVKARRALLRGDLVHLTPTEFDLVVRLARARGAVLSRERLLNEVWGYSGGFGARTVDSHVRAVRRKLGDDAVRTVHAVGYAIGPPEPTT